jgi:hypothetical protein
MNRGLRLQNQFDFGGFRGGYIVNPKVIISFWEKLLVVQPVVEKLLGTCKIYNWDVEDGLIKINLLSRQNIFSNEDKDKYFYITCQGVMHRTKPIILWKQKFLGIFSERLTVFTKLCLDLMNSSQIWQLQLDLIDLARILTVLLGSSLGRLLGGIFQTLDSQLYRIQKANLLIDSIVIKNIVFFGNQHIPKPDFIMGCSAFEIKNFGLILSQVERIFKLLTDVTFGRFKCQKSIWLPSDFRYFNCQRLNL